MALLILGLSAVLAPARSTAALPAPEWAKQLTAASPEARHYAEMVYDEETEEIVLTGGEDGVGAGTWTYNGETWTERAGSPAPAELHLAGAAYDEATEEVVLAGGDIGGSRKSLTWTWNGSKWKVRKPTVSFPALDSPAMAYDPESEEVVLFGGVEEGSFSSETWTYNGELETWTKQTTKGSPPSLYGASMVYDEELEELVLVGGMHQGSQENETWTYNNETRTWTKQSPAEAPPAGSYGSMAYDGETGEVVRFGVYDYGQNGETWSYDGTTWKKDSSRESPSPRFGGSMAYDEATGNVVFFGGTEEPEGMEPSNGPFAETWLFELPVAAEPSLSQAASGGVVLGGSIQDQATLSEGSSPTGTITFSLYGPADGKCEASPVFVGEATVSGNGSYESAAFTPAEAGTYHWIASYSGDSANEEAETACGAAVTVSEPSKTGETPHEGSTEVPPVTPKANPPATPISSPAPVLAAAAPRLRIYTKAPKGLINSHSVLVDVGCGAAACTVNATAQVQLTGMHRRIVLSGHTSVGAGKIAAVAFPLSKKVRGELRSFLLRHRGEHMRLALVATMTAPGAPSQKVSTVLTAWTLPGLR